MGKCQNLKFP